MAINFREHPRGGVDNQPVENTGETHLPCVILVDTSGSMESEKEQLRKGLEEMAKALDGQARGRVEFCVIGFDDEANILIPFGPTYGFKAPSLTFGGMTSMHKAIDYALGELEARKAQYVANQTLYYRPWIYLLTDGGSNDADNGAFERLIQAQKGKHCTFFPVAIGENADKNLLKSLRVDGPILTAKKDDFVNSFVWLSNSLSKTSSSNPGEKIALPSPRDYQMEIES